MKPIPVILLVNLFLTIISCNQVSRKISDKEIKNKTDSIMLVRKAEIELQSREDLEVRKTIEVKAKADSIVNVRRYGPEKVVESNINSDSINNRPIDPRFGRPDSQSLMRFRNRRHPERINDGDGRLK